MKFLLLFSLIFVVMSQQENVVTQNDSDLVVIKFSWSKFRPFQSISPLPSISEGTSFPSATSNPHQSRSIPRPNARREDPERIVRTSTSQNRASELTAVEQNAVAQAKPRPDMYLYRIQLKNNGKKEIRSFVWEYKDSTASNLPARQFFCLVKIKPNETRKLDVLSYLTPSRIVSASHAKDDSKLNEKVSLNQIEYSDGFTWQRTYWDPASLYQAPGLAVSRGKCVSL